MNTEKFKSFFPTVITDSLFNDSYLDQAYERLIKFPSNFIQMEKYRVISEDNLWNIEIPFPGTSREDLKISLKDSDRLLIEVVGENNWTSGEKREFKLPGSADRENISAEMKNGLLTVSVPKKKTFQDRLVKVK